MTAEPTTPARGLRTLIPSPSSRGAMPKPVFAWGAALALALLSESCTTHYTVPQSAEPCAKTCQTTLQQCLTSCAESTGHPEIVEDVREHLCTKRCREAYETCVPACPGVH
jgi:hypothetical protein